MSGPLDPVQYGRVVPIPLDDGWPAEPVVAIDPKTSGWRLSFEIAGVRKYYGHHYATREPVDTIVGVVRERITKGEI